MGQKSEQSKAPNSPAILPQEVPLEQSLEEGLKRVQSEDLKEHRIDNSDMLILEYLMQPDRQKVWSENITTSVARVNSKKHILSPSAAPTQQGIDLGLLWKKYSRLRTIALSVGFVMFWVSLLNNQKAVSWHEEYLTRQQLVPMLQTAWKQNEALEQKIRAYLGMGSEQGEQKWSQVLIKQLSSENIQAVPQRLGGHALLFEAAENKWKEEGRVFKREYKIYSSFAQESETVRALGDFLNQVRQWGRAAQALQKRLAVKTNQEGGAHIEVKKRSMQYGVLEWSDGRLVAVVSVHNNEKSDKVVYYFKFIDNPLLSSTLKEALYRYAYPSKVLMAPVGAAHGAFEHAYELQKTEASAQEGCTHYDDVHCLSEGGSKYVALPMPLGGSFELQQYEAPKSSFMRRAKDFFAVGYKEDPVHLLNLILYSLSLKDLPKEDAVVIEP